MRLALVLLIVGCHASSTGGGSSAGGSSGASGDDKSTGATPDPCGAAALGLGTAKPLAAWTPAGCTAKGGGPAVIASDADAAAQLDCTSPLGIDFAKQALVVVTRSWSPAQTGELAFDDGSKVTLVSRQRSPCPDEPRPMPTPPITSLFLTDANGARTFAQGSCTVATTCP